MPGSFPKAAAQVRLLVRAYVNAATKGCRAVNVIILVRDLHAKCFGVHGGAPHWASEFVCFVRNLASS